jgi:hypothetical protein
MCPVRSVTYVSGRSLPLRGSYGSAGPPINLQHQIFSIGAMLEDLLAAIQTERNPK